MSKTQVTLALEGPIARIHLSTPDGLNVLSTAVLDKLDDTVSQIQNDRSIRVCILRGEGKVFAAGADIKEMSEFSVDQARRYGELGSGVMDNVAKLSCVTLAALNGAALGGGLELALACDFRYAVRTAKVGLPEVTLGLIPGWAGTKRLPRLIGPARAKMLILSGEPIKAEEGVAMGLIDDVVNSTEDLDARVHVIAKKFLKVGPQAIAQAKRALRDGDDVYAFADCFADGADGRPGMKAFLEKRKAPFVVE